MPKIDDEIDFLLYVKGEDIKRNSINERALLLDDISNFKDYKTIVSNLQLKAGDLIEAEDYKWLIVSEVTKDKNSYNATMRKALNDITFNYYGIFYPITSIQDVQILDTTTNTFMTLPNGRIQLTLTYDDFLHKHISLGTRFFSMNQAFKTVGINISQEGLIILTLDIDSINSTYDDVTNNIADGLKYTVSIVVNDATNDIIKMQNGYEFDLNYYIKSVYSTTIYKLTDIECILTSSDENIFKVNSNEHVIPVNIGNANLTITIKNKPEVTKTINIQIIDTPARIISLSGSSTLNFNSSTTYTATVKTNYITDTSETVTWSLTDTNGAATTLATITSSTGTTCTIKANNSSLAGYIRLRATSTTDNTLYGDIIVQIKSPLS